jgi:hypothetical protein
MSTQHGPCLAVTWHVGCSSWELSASWRLCASSWFVLKMLDGFLDVAGTGIVEEEKAQNDVFCESNLVFCSGSSFWWVWIAIAKSSRPYNYPRRHETWLKRLLHTYKQSVQQATQSTLECQLELISYLKLLAWVDWVELVKVAILARIATYCDYKGTCSSI